MDILQILIDFFSGYGYEAVFVVLLLCGFGVPIPEDITLVAGGIIAGLGYTDVDMMFIVGMAGVLIGDGIMFSLGRLLGHRVMQIRPISRILTPQRFCAVQEKFTRYGNGVLFVARFLPGLRSPIFICAGMSRRVSPLRFLLLDGMAAAISVPVWVYLGYLGAENRDWLMMWVHRGQAGLLAFSAILLSMVLFLCLRRKKSRCE
jgi:membrane protein DedA with SNARE-associated domain